MNSQEPDFEPFYKGITLIKFGKSGNPKESEKKHIPMIIRKIV